MTFICYTLRISSFPSLNNKIIFDLPGSRERGAELARRGEGARNFISNKPQKSIT